VFSKVSIASTSTHILLTSPQVTHLVVTSTMSSVIRVLHLMTLVCSIAHTFLCRWYVPLGRTPSSLRSALRPATVSLLTHSQTMAHWQALPQRVHTPSPQTQTATTEEYRSETSCDFFHKGLSEDPTMGSFFYK